MQPERIDVRPRIGGVRPTALFGGHVFRCPHHQARAGLHANLAGELGDAEVEHRHALSAEHLGVRARNRLSGLRSRCVMSAACAAGSTFATWRRSSVNLYSQISEKRERRRFKMIQVAEATFVASGM
jgi:hypothetical protein